MLSPADALRPLPLQRRYVEHLRSTAPALWAWHAAQAPALHAEALRLQLLKTSVRLEPEAEPQLFAAARAAQSAFGIELPLTIYQSALAEGRNAALWFLPEELHVVLSGPLSEELSASELQALFAHELAHHALYRAEDGAYRIAGQILDSALQEADAPPSARASALRYRRAMEVYADRAALAVAGSLEAAVGCLLKTATGLKRIDAAAFVRQAEEVLEKDPNLRSQGLTHPEAFLRARALAAFAREEEQADERVVRWIEGELELERLDLLDQHRVQRSTRELLRAALAPEWMRSDELLAHARAFEPELDPLTLENECDEAALGARLAAEGPGLRDYWCYLLLDLAALSEDESDLALWRGLELAEHFDARERLSELARTELGRTKKALEKLAKEAPVKIAALEKREKAPAKRRSKAKIAAEADPEDAAPADAAPKHEAGPNDGAAPKDETATKEDAATKDGEA
ncbi:MAG: M48 family metalloprotease [Planctomycetes bacterium]|nr:M48 family metalloprotease [Planctomycetota bacterium]